jgi:hypothetical protein
MRRDQYRWSGHVQLQQCVLPALLSGNDTGLSGGDVSVTSNWVEATAVKRNSRHPGGCFCLIERIIGWPQIFAVEE